VQEGENQRMRAPGYPVDVRHAVTSKPAS